MRFAPWGMQGGKEQKNTPDLSSWQLALTPTCRSSSLVTAARRTYVFKAVVPFLSRDHVLHLVVHVFLQLPVETLEMELEVQPHRAGETAICLMLPIASMGRKRE